MVGYTIGTIIFLLSLIGSVNDIPILNSPALMIGWWGTSIFCFVLSYAYRKSKNQNNGDISMKKILVACLGIILLSVSIFSMGALLYFGKGMAYGAMGYLIITILALMLLTLFIGFVALIYFILKTTSLTGTSIHTLFTKLLEKI